MKRFVIIICVAQSIFYQHNLSFAGTFLSSDTKVKVAETEIRVFTFKMNKLEDKAQVEKTFSDPSKFVHLKYHSNMEVSVYTDENISESEFNDILVSIGIRTKTLQMEVISKTEFYKKHKKK